MTVTSGYLFTLSIRVLALTKMFIKKLNKQFCTSEAVSHGEDMGMGRRNVMYTLSKLQRLGFITQVQHGKYEKICDLDGS